MTQIQAFKPRGNPINALELFQGFLSKICDIIGIGLSFSTQAVEVMRRLTRKYAADPPEPADTADPGDPVVHPKYIIAWVLHAPVAWMTVVNTNSFKL